MNIIINPSFLEINDTSTEKCPLCNTLLEKEIKKHKEKIFYECAYCRYQDRPFGIGSSSLQHFSEGCRCEVKELGEEIDTLFISCANCSKPKCSNCKKDIIGILTFGQDNLCDTCKLNQKKIEFNNKWITSSAQEKLYLHGLEKLKILAKKKNIKGYSQKKKSELILLLSPLVKNEDFPIK